MTDAQGLPLAAALSAANVAEGPTLPTMVQAAQAILPPEQSVEAVHGDKAFDSRANRIFCRLNHLRCNIPERGQRETALGRKRWVIERTFAWLKRFRRLAVRYDRRADIHLGLLLLGCALIASNFCR